MEIKNNQEENNKNNANHKAPIFAKKNRLPYVILHFVIIVILEAAGIGMLIHPEGNNIYGIICVVFGVIYLCIYIPQFLTEFKGKEVYGKLLEIASRQLYHGIRKYAVIELNGKVVNVSLPFNRDYNEWDYIDGMNLLEKYLGKEIPLKVFGKKVIINFKKMYYSQF